MPKLEPARLHHLFASQYLNKEITKIAGPRQNEAIIVTDDAVIFYPSSDVPADEKTPINSSKGIGNPITLEDTLRNVHTTTDYQNKTLYIPVTEERNRKHFVLLTISADRKSATLYDSKNTPNCFLKFFCCRHAYPTQFIVDQVQNAFPSNQIDQVETVHLGSQSVGDDHSCGYQVVAMMLALTQGIALEKAAISSKVSELQKLPLCIPEEEYEDADVISIASNS